MIAGLTEREYHRRYYYKRRAKLIAVLGDRCVRCGDWEHLEFDHVDPDEKSFDIKDNMTASNPEVLAELLKCQLLCRDCHIEKTRAEAIERGFTHGTWYGWMDKKCQCPDCEAAHRKYNEGRRARRIAEGGGVRGQYGRPANHGEILMYRRGCKCDLCKRANNAYAKTLRDKTAG